MTVSADPIRIAQVLRNLVKNSVRYTSAGRVRGRVEPFVSQASAVGDAASTPETSLAGASDTYSSGGVVRFVVHDTGPGLPPAALERLRSATVPFASSAAGTGIGLFVIRDVLQQLSGRLEIQARDAADPEGQGTRSTVSIPASR